MTENTMQKIISSSISLRKTEISSLRDSSNSTAFRESLNGSHSTALGSCQKDKNFILARLISKGDLVTPSQENKSLMKQSSLLQPSTKAVKRNKWAGECWLL
ncbi:hypothetical protein CDAR_309351 [Caerostris darwini]|uniref:Uncharacterized protein n=1 Tax=Caerostris darwini TaxID=1538125 RepID=A0AAV4MP75_9ARAC|nr:hypothetical protein CDAR_309351 [Caerostris darwini]